MPKQSAKAAKVIDFTQHRRTASPTILRMVPELDGLEMLYTNDSSDQVFSLKVLCWAIWSDGHVDGMVPWLNQLVPCRSLQDPLNGHWEGFMDPATQQIMFEAPQYKIQFLEGAASYYQPFSENPDEVIQEIPDTIGTHAVFTHDEFESFTIQEIHSWRLYNDGTILAMAIEANDVQTTPVLPGDDCLYSVQHHKGFRYFFQHKIANKLKANDPDALAAMSHLGDH